MISSAQSSSGLEHHYCPYLTKFSLKFQTQSIVKRLKSLLEIQQNVHVHCTLAA
jgi:protein-tyrosine phosphatase